MDTTTVSQTYPTGQGLRADQAVDTGVAPVRGPGFVLPIVTLWRREMIRFFRQRNRVISAVGMPLVFWLGLGLGLNRAFAPPAEMQSGPDTAAQTSESATPSPATQSHTTRGGDQFTPVNVGYFAYFFPGTVMLMVLFTAVFSTIGVIEDRRAGFLQAVLASPAPRFGVVMGEVLGGTSIAAVQGLLFLGLWPLVGQWPGWLSMVGAAAVLFAIAVGLTALGLCVGWSMRSTASFHAVMNLVLMPMWLFCGAVFPIQTAGPVTYLMYANPLTYCYATFVWLLWPSEPMAHYLPGAVSLPIMVGLIALVLGLAVMIAGKPET